MIFPHKIFPTKNYFYRSVKGALFLHGQHSRAFRCQKARRAALPFREVHYIYFCPTLVSLGSCLLCSNPDFVTALKAPWGKKRRGASTGCLMTRYPSARDAIQVRRSEKFFGSETCRSVVFMVPLHSSRLLSLQAKASLPHVRTYLLRQMSSNKDGPPRRDGISRSGEGIVIFCRKEALFFYPWGEGKLFEGGN